MLDIRITEKKEISEDVVVLNWISKDGSFGDITIKYLNNGHYDIDAEYLDLESVINIIKKI